MTQLAGWALVMCGVMLATPSIAADQAITAPRERQYVVAVSPPPLFPPCREAFWATSLYCVPRVDIYAPSDPALHSYLRSLRPVKRKPYVQVFNW
jgi:hypothetical protein